MKGDKMNIHFTEEHNLNNSLDELTVFRTEVGSTMYGLETEDSDIDYLSIYIEPTFNRNTILWEHHQLQYKCNNIDFNYTTLQTFIRNILTGDSTINFEVLWSDDLKNSSLSFLYDFRYDFINYNIIRSYLGLAIRDLNNWKKLTRGGNTKESNKMLSHFVRGVLFAQQLLKNEFNLTKDSKLLLDIKLGNGSDSVINGLSVYFDILMNHSRQKLNDKLKKGEIDKIINLETLRLINGMIQEYCNEVQSKQSVSRIDYRDLFTKDFGKNINY